MKYDIEQLVRDGWKSTSNRYRTLARLEPKPGETILDVLRRVDPLQAERCERNMLVMLLRGGYPDSGVEELELTVEDFAAFKKAGGEVA